MPEPLREIVRREFNALLAIEMLPEAFPGEVGERAAVKVVLWPAPSGNGSDNPLTLKPVPDGVV